MTPTEHTIPVGEGAVTSLRYRARGAARATLILGHGAGAGQTSPFMVAAAEALAARGLAVATFNFPYTQAGRGLPDRPPVLEACWRAIIEATPSRGRRLFIGGKSMGGRLATMVAAAGLPDLAGLVLLGYPLHPPGQPKKLRDTHLPSVRAPMLFVQGTRDPFGTPAELAPYLPRLARGSRIFAVDEGDHSFKVPRKQPAPLEGIYDEIVSFIG